MKSAPNHVDEELRVQALHRLGILDTGREERFDRVTRLLATVLDVPIPVQDEAEAQSIADRIHDAIGGQHARGLPDGLAQASVGVAVSEPGDTPSTLMQRADAALYATKATRAYSHAASYSGT